MIYTVKPIKKMYLIYNGNDFAVEVCLHPNQKWLAYEFGEDCIYVSKGAFTIKMTRDNIYKYFREVEE